MGASCLSLSCTGIVGMLPMELPQDFEAIFATRCVYYTYISIPLAMLQMCVPLATGVVARVQEMESTSTHRQEVLGQQAWPLSGLISSPSSPLLSAHPGHVHFCSGLALPVEPFPCPPLLPATGGPPAHPRSHLRITACTLFLSCSQSRTGPSTVLRPLCQSVPIMLCCVHQFTK